MITTKEEVYNINSIVSHYHPKIYLSKYKFSKEILLNIFCSEDLVFCYEDYYYDDISLSMIEEFQTHIDINEFEILWDDLDEIRTIELFCDLIIKKDISTYKYNLINKYIKKYGNNNNFNFIFNKIIEDFNYLLKTNKFAIKFNLDKFQIELNDTTSEITLKVKKILEFIPLSYISILPL